MKPWEDNLGCVYSINWSAKPQRNICQLYENGRKQLELLLNQGSVFSIDNVIHVYHNFNYTALAHSSTKLLLTKGLSSCPSLSMTTDSGTRDYGFYIYINIYKTQE